MDKIAIVIPAYEPDERLISLIEDLTKKEIGPIYIVNDGSAAEFDVVFDAIKDKVEKSGGLVLNHEINKGKGRALKTAFEYILNNEPNVQVVVTADSDGQHTGDCILRVMNASRENKNSLVLGIRTFEDKEIPWKSSFGNKLTEKVFKYVTGVHITDTQTGLRAIPRDYLPELLNIKGERFEFEMRMLIDAVEKLEIVEVPIKTIYESKENHQTHFDPIKDSIRIYRILGERFIKFIFSSVSSCLLDLILFGVLCHFLKAKDPILYVTYATVIARIFSAMYNYGINYGLVFKSKENVGKAAAKYFLLAVIQMICSALLVTGLVNLFPNGIEVIFKAIVDTMLFFVSYSIQQKLVFKKISQKQRTLA